MPPVINIRPGEEEDEETTSEEEAQENNVTADPTPQQQDTVNDAGPSRAEEIYQFRSHQVARDGGQQLKSLRLHLHPPPALSAE